MIGRIVSHYEITEQLGRGGMGIVYKALDTKLKRTVALKFLPSHLSSDADAKNRFIQEAQAASALDHANICTVYEIGETAEPGAGPEVYIAMAYYPGQTLNYRLETEDFTAERAADIARQLAAGLGRAHEEGIVHRDVKPANIMITDRGEVKLLDFGLAKLLGTAEMTQAGSTLGTASYMSPEQVKGDEITPSVDLWSLGVVLYEMLAGKKPFTGEYEQAAMYAILNETPDDVAALRPDLPQEITDLVTRCLAKNPAERPASAVEIQNAIVASGLASGSGTHTFTSPAATPAPPASRPKWLVPAIAAGTVVVLAIVAVLLWPRVSDSPTVATVASEPAIAVLPFSIGGDPGLDYLRNGMVRLLSTRFDGMGKIRGIDPNALLVQPELNSSAEIDPTTGIEIAKRFNAENFLIGSVLRIGGPIQVSANMYDRSGTSVAYSEVTIASDSLLLSAVDDIARELLTGKFEGPAMAMSSMAVQSTASFDALRDYLRGEELMHEGQFDDAKPFFQSAIDKDSLFALAWLRLADAYSWTDWNDPTSDAAARKAMQLSSRLPRLYRERLKIKEMLKAGNFEPAIARAERLHEQHPDDVHTLLLLGDYQWHYNAFYGKPANDAEQYFREILRIDPSLAEAKFHLTEILGRTGRYAEAESLANTSAGDTFEMRARMARIANAYSDTLFTLDQLRDHLTGLDEDRIAELAWRIASRLGRPEIGREVMRLLPAGEYEATTYWVSVMSGQFTNNAPITDEVSSEMWYEALTFYPMDAGQIEQIAAGFQVPVDTTGLEEWRRQWGPAQIFIDNFPAMREFGLALTDWRRADMDALRNRQRTLAAMSDGKKDNNLAFSFSHTVEALLLWNEDRIDEADAAFQQSIIPVSLRITNTSPFDLATSRFLRGKMLFEAGRYEDALRWLSAVDDGFLHAEELLFPAMYVRAQAHENLSRHEEAVALYKQFIRAWEEADPALQPMVEYARNQLNALVLKSAREPA